MNRRRRNRILGALLLVLMTIAMASCDNVSVGVGVSVGYPGPWVGGRYGGYYPGGPIIW